MNKETITNYTLEEEKTLSDIDSMGYVLRHNKSGARVILIENDDNNKTFCIGFRTTPSDDTGVAHIMEHSVLCGSAKFPVKDPFMELVKGSLNTFLNAMTFPDKTIYPVASTNDKDFQNLMDVYLDSVFHPKVYEREEIFCQEGVTYSLESEDAELKYNGVVYNEMKGAFSAPDEVLERMITHSLFPDTCYGVESGGNPDFIPELTYEKFLEFHRTYYHPSNSYIYIYGDMDMNQTLEWLDAEYLNAFENIKVDSEIGYQKPFEKLKEVREEYSVSESEPLENNTYLSYNFVTGDILDKELYLALQILEYAIISMPGAPVKQALLDKGIGKDISGRYNNYILQPYFTFTAKNANEADKDVFVETIRETMQSLYENGIDKSSLLAALNNFEFQYRENEFGSYPKGLMFSFQVFDSWLYADDAPFRHLEQNEQFAKLRELLNTDYFEQLLKQYFIDNTHASLVVVVPVRGLTVKKEEELRKKLAEIKAGMSEEEIKKIVEKTKALKIYQETPSTKEELDTIPVLQREDLSDAVEPFYNEEVKFMDTTIVKHDIFTNGIGYFNFSFDITDIPRELMSYLSILKGIFGYVNTEHYSYSELSNEIGIHTGGFYQENSLYRNVQDFDKYRLSVEIKGKVFFDKIDKALELIEEIIFNSKVRDKKRLYEIICEGKTNLQGYLLRSSDSAAVVRNLSYLTKTSAITEVIKGITNYKFIEALEKDFDNQWENLADKLEQLMRFVFRKDNLVIGYTANAEGYTMFEKNVGTLLSRLEEHNVYKDCFAGMSREIPVEKKNEGFKDSAQVQYVTRAGNFLNHGFEYQATLKVLKTILTSEFLWKQIREQGGAYGCSCGFGKAGECFFSSYRDPNLKRTNDVFMQVPDYIRAFETDERNMTKYIIGTISPMETPLTAVGKGNRSMNAYFNNESVEKLQKEKQEILKATQEDIRALADLVECVLRENSICVIGNESVIEAEEDLFYSKKNLFD